MSRFLFAWELGGGLGHISRLVPIADRLHAGGHRVQLALKDLFVLDIVPPGPGITVMQAPVCIRVYGGLADPPLNYAEILMRYGYLDPRMLFGLVTAWRSMIEQMGADIVVADHSPTAMIAAMTLGVRSILLGNPFFVPPRVAPTPNMRTWVEIPAERLKSSDSQVLSSINTVLARFHKPALARLHQLFAVKDVLFLTYPELDHYGQRSAEELSQLTYFGPLASIERGIVAPQWPVGGGKRIYAYLKPEYPHIDAVLKALADSGMPTVVYGLGAAPPFAARVKSPTMAFSEKLIDLAVAGRECSVAICHAGGAAGELLRSGLPLLLLPMQLEQFLCAKRVVELGAGQVINPEDKAPDIGGALSRVLADGAYAENAKRFAAKYRDQSPDSILASVVHRLAADAKPQ